MKLVSMKLRLLATAAVLALGAPLAVAQTPAPLTPEVGSKKQNTPATDVQPPQKQPGAAKQQPAGTAKQQPAQNRPDTAKQDRVQTQGPSTEKGRTQVPATEKRQPAQTDQRMPGQPRNTGTEKERRTPTAGTSDRRGPSASLTTEQRSRIRAEITRQNVRAVPNVNFSINVGTRIPQSVRLYPFSPVMIEYMPEYRGFMYFLVGDEIIVVDSRTREIVAIYPA